MASTLQCPALPLSAACRLGRCEPSSRRSRRPRRRRSDRTEPLNPSGIIPVLASGLRATRAARTTIASMARSNATADADFLLARKEDEFSAALTRAAGVIVDPLANDETLQPGGTIGVTIRTFAEEANLARVVSATVRAPEGWTVTSAVDSARSPNSPAGRREVPTHSAAYLVTAPTNAPPTQPYFLAVPRTGDVYRWPDAAPKGLPFAPSLLTAVVELDIAGNRLTSLQPVQYRYADPVRGELRRDVNVVPALIVALDSPLFIVPTGSAARSQRVVARATSFSGRPMTGVIRLRVPPGWTVTPDPSPFSVAAKGDSASATFMVTAPARRAPGRQEIAAEAFSGASFVSSMQTIAYPHIQTHRLYTPAVAAAQVFDLKVAAVRVGYIMGSGDQVPDALRRMGVDVAVLDDETIASGELSGFDTIVVGVRATEARPAFLAHQSRLRQFMERGGTLIVQYQQQEYASRNLPPYPAEAASNSRVTDETARVRILAPAHPVFTFPNRITASDFDGWVQERNLYAFTGFDARYTPLLESADPGEPPQRGGELYAAVGKGHYVYTAYAWFRQLPAGVPGRVPAVRESDQPSAGAEVTRAEVRRRFTSPTTAQLQIERTRRA